MTTPEQVFDACLRKLNLPARGELDWETETPQQYARRFTNEAHLLKAWRFAQLLDAKSCEEAMRGRRS